MYEHYKPVERVFVNRDTYLTWMDEAIKRCREKSVVLHLGGIGGIGKSSLLEHWNESVGNSTILDCDRAMDFFDRLDALAKRAVRLGVTLRRFDILWHIRQRFIKGVEPARETGRDWRKMERNDEIEEIHTKLSELGIDEIHDLDVWIEEDEEF